MDLDTGSDLNSIVNYSIILSGLVILIFLVAISISRFVKHEKFLQKKLPHDLPKRDPWGYPLEEKTSSSHQDPVS